MTEPPSQGKDNVVPLGADPPPSDQEPDSGTVPSGSSLALVGMALCAVVALVSLLAFITVRWPGDIGGYLLRVAVGAGLGFMVCASAAIFAAARNSYARTIGEAKAKGPRHD